ncbi:MAG: hypothetical protein Q8K79_16550 [Solirubrobacteraceae bacterium]|nr:hypothetical protein [Solirubrobacteraceae bacterium]
MQAYRRESLQREAAAPARRPGVQRGSTSYGTLRWEKLGANGNRRDSVYVLACDDAYACSMFRAMRVVLVWLTAGLVFSSGAHACTLPAVVAGDEVRAVERKVRAADVAIYGVVSSVRVLKTPPDRPIIGQRFEARVRITRVFRGMTVRVVRVRGDTNTASCGIGALRVGQRLGLLLDRPSRPYRVGLHSRIAMRDLLLATRGKWHRPA